MRNKSKLFKKLVGNAPFLALAACFGLALGVCGIFYGYQSLGSARDEQFVRERLENEVQYVHRETARSFSCVERFLKDFSRSTTSWMSPEGLSEIFKREAEGCPLLGGVSILNSDGKTWGVGTVSERDQVLVRPKTNGAALERYFLDERGLLVANSRKDIPNPKVSSLWPWLSSSDTEHVRWTAPYTSKVIDEAVISAAINGDDDRIYSAHVRLSDLSRLIAKRLSPSLGGVMLFDSQGKGLMYPTGFLLREERAEAKELLSMVSSDSLFYDSFQEWHHRRWPERLDFRVDQREGAYSLGSVRSITIGDQRVGLFVVSPEIHMNRSEVVWMVCSLGLVLVALVVLVGSLINSKRAKKGHLIK